MQISLFRPEYEDLWFRRQMLGDEKTMSYNRAWGGTIDFEEERWTGWYAKWVEDPGRERFYRYVSAADGRFVGEAAYHLDHSSGVYLADILVYAPYRNLGYGGEALELLCAAAKDAGVDVLYDDIAADNPAILLFLRHGFSEDCRSSSSVLLKRILQQKSTEKE